MSRDLHALLIGIDCYLPNQLPDGSSYQSLKGSVRDIEQVAKYLAHESPQPPVSVRRLTASRGEDGRPREPREQWPTYENMVAAFRELTDQAAPGDQVYIHYSGHGGRTATLFPDIKGVDGYDESLVPCDIGDPASKYLLGAEMSWLLQKMAEKGLVVSLVFDCCHSGGANRGQGEATARGMEVIDTRPRAADSLVAPLSELLALQQRRTVKGPATRNVTMEGWLPDPQGYVFLAACRPQELAYEYPFDGKESHGALTYWLLDSLRHGGTSLTYKQLHQRILAKVHNQFWSQTPMVMGEVDRVFFGTHRVVSRNAVTVIAVEGMDMLLDVGQAHGVRPGMRFSIHRPDVPSDHASERLAVVEVRDVDAVRSRAEIVETTRTLVEAGAQAIPLGCIHGPGVLRLQSAVRVVPDGDGPGDALLADVRRAIRGEPSGFLRLAETDQPVDYQIAVSPAGRLAILDSGGVPVPNVPCGTAGNPGETVERLVHLTRYRNIQQLDNADEESPLAGKLELVPLGTQSDFVKGDTPHPQPFAGSEPYEIQAGDWAFFKIANRSSLTLNVVAIDLAPDWSITQVSPGRNGPAFWPLDPGKEKQVQIHSSLPAGCERGTDIIKVIATLGPANFRWLELPALGVSDAEVAAHRGNPTNPLEELFARLSTRQPATRNLEVAEYASEKWTTAQVEVRMHGASPKK